MSQSDVERSSADRKARPAPPADAAKKPTSRLRAAISLAARHRRRVEASTKPSGKELSDTDLDKIVGGSSPKESGAARNA